MKTLDGFKWYPQSNSIMACLKSCLDYLGADLSLAWLYGGTGHAFVINIDPRLDPADATAWDYTMLYELIPNIGFRVRYMFYDKNQAEAIYPAKQREAWDFVRAAIDRGSPCYGWMLHPYIPDFFLITGYEAEGETPGYYFDGYEKGGPVPWQKLGDMGVNVLQVYAVERCAPASDATVLKDALAAAVQRSAAPDGWTVAPDQVSGPASFDLWENAATSGEARRNDHAFIAAVWHENRSMAAAFLQEARQRLAGKLSPACDAALEEAQTHYIQVRDALEKVCLLTPMNPDPAAWNDPQTIQSEETAALLHQAGIAEKQAVRCLGEALSCWEE